MTRNFYSLLVCICVLAVSCNKEQSHENNARIDADARKFLDSAGIKADTFQVNAINKLVTQLKDSGLWSKFSAIYPMVGGTARSLKWNLKDPRDLDKAFRLTFSGNPVYASTGVLFPTNADYADTHLYDSLLTYNDNSIAYYSRTQNKVSGYDMGCLDNKVPFNEMTIYHTSNATDFFGLYRYGYAPASTVGLFMISATATNSTWYENGVNNFVQASVPKNSFTGSSILLGYCKFAESGGKRECSFSSIGTGLSEKEAKTYYTIVANFHAYLKR